MVLSPSDLWFRRKHNYHSMIEWFITNVKHTQVACVAGGFCGVYFFCGSQSKSYSRPKVEPRSKQNTIGEGARGEGAAESLTFNHKRKKHTKKSTSDAGLSYVSFHAIRAYVFMSSPLLWSPVFSRYQGSNFRAEGSNLGEATESLSWHERGKFFFTATFRGQIFCHSFEIRQDWKFSEVSWRYKESFGWNRRQHSSGQRWKKCLSENRAWEGKILSTAYD